MEQVWPIPFLINMLTALKGSQFSFYFIHSTFFMSCRIRCIVAYTRVGQKVLS